MSRNGSGTYTLPSGNPVVTGTTITSTWANTTLSDIATALTNSIASDGQTPVTANLPMAGFKFTGLGNGSAASDSAALGQCQGVPMWCGTAGGTADALTLTPTPAISAYTAGQVFIWKAGASNNTGATTIAVSGLTTKAAQNSGAALGADVIVANKWYASVYDGAAFQLWRVTPAGGDVFGPSSVTNNSLAKWDGTTGKLLKNGAVIGTDVQAWGATLDSLEGLSLVAGDILYATAADTLQRLAKGTALQGLRMNSGATAPEWATSSSLTLATYTSLSGTSIEFTSIPTTTKRIVCEFNVASSNGANAYLVQIGPSGGVETSSYTSSLSGTNNGGTVSLRTSTSGFVWAPASAASDTNTGTLTLTLIDSATNTWVASGVSQGPLNGTASVYFMAGVKAMAGAISRLKFTAGGDTFDGGSVNILYD